jgi:hypothetical protein
MNGGGGERSFGYPFIPFQIVDFHNPMIIPPFIDFGVRKTGTTSIPFSDRSMNNPLQYRINPPRSFVNVNSHRQFFSRYNENKKSRRRRKH